MIALIYRGPGGITATLTTESTASHYNIPVLRIGGRGLEDYPDLGPADLLPTGQPAALLVEAALTGDLPDGWAGELLPLDDEAQAAASRYLMQWPDRWSGRGQIADNIALVMRVRDVSQRELGRRLGTSQAYVGGMLAPPHARLSEAAVARIAEALGVPVEWLSDPALAGKTVDELRRGAMIRYEIQRDNANKYRVIRTGPDGVRRAWDSPACDTREEAEEAIRGFMAEDAGDLDG